MYCSGLIMKIYYITFIIILYCKLAFDVRCVTARNSVIIDTDPGSDDALAILLALAYEKSSSEDFKVLAITCTYGNTYLENVEKNVLKILEIADRSDIPVYSGSKKSLIYNFTASNYFGKDGLGDFEFDKNITGKINRTKHASMVIVDMAKQYPDEITIICLGPLTNIATAIILEPNLQDYVKNIFIMGGSVAGIGNFKPNVEYNFGNDPESNFISLNSTTKTPVILIPWDVCLSYKISLEWRYNVFGKLNSTMVDFLNKAERIALNSTVEWCPIDTIAVATVIWPAFILKSTLKNIYPVIDGTGRGSILVDYAESTDRIKNAKIIQEYDMVMLKDKLLHYFQ
ncbi:probable uridine nucleosidase 2 isoform X1 [Vespa velutina]|uniref:probable uridine nucleosidase 2 isoform X1 n=2 Tax=Vespa velutina TaxID=202808 RepID=UPI001FB3227E|nr:probable uridine nucleosidase 2 isoform X1 [Vespa velutina]